MSLTSELSRPASPITQFVRFAGATVADSGRGAPWADACKQLLGLKDLRATTAVVPVPGANSSVVGIAFDYRLRYHLAPCRASEFVASTGAGLVVQRFPTLTLQLQEFFADLDAVSEQLAPAGRRLDDETERLLCRYCVVLAQFEQVYRTGGVWCPPSLDDDDPTRTTGADLLLKLASDDAARDVMNLSRSAEVVFAPFIASVVERTRTYTANPVFAGSRAIGGADADFIIGDTLFELKTTNKLDGTAVRKALLQLLGYCLLDYDDHFGIRNVGVYFARQQWIASWPLWQLAFPPAAVIQMVAAYGVPPSADFAERITKLRGLMKRVVGGGAIDYEGAFS